MQMQGRISWLDCEKRIAHSNPRTIFENVSGSMCILSPQQQLVPANKAVTRGLQWPAAAAAKCAARTC